MRQMIPTERDSGESLGSMWSTTLSCYFLIERLIDGGGLATRLIISKPSPMRRGIEHPWSSSNQRKRNGQSRNASQIRNPSEL